MNSLSKEGIKDNVTNRILAMKFASEFILIYPLITIMYGEYGNVSAAGIGVILAIGFALSVLFEIPTGIIADKISRKYVLTASILSKILGLLLWLTWPDFIGYIFAATLFALSYALESGTLQAYMYGVLGDENKKFFGKFWARVHAMTMISYSIAYLLTPIVGINYPLLVGLSVLPCIVALIICISLPKDNIAVSTATVKPKIFNTAVKHINGSSELKKLLLSGIIMVALAYLLIEYISLYYRQIGVNIRLIPILLAAGNILGAILFWTFHSWEEKLDKLKLILLVVASVLFALSFRGGIVAAAAGILLYTRFVRLLQVQFESKLQHLSNDETRATISSIGGFAAALLAAGLSTLIGLLAIDNVILKPMRTVLIFGSIAFIAVHALIRYRRKDAILAEL